MKVKFHLEVILPKYAQKQDQTTCFLVAYMQQFFLSKQKISIDERVIKDINKFPRFVQEKCQAILNELEREGCLKEPFAKKIDKDVFEIRLSLQGQWRLLYTYLENREILILSAFRKKTQKTPKAELVTFRKRLQEYK